MEYTAAALFEEFYAIEGVNKAASPDSFYRAIEDIVFTPFDYDSERNNINVQEPVVEIPLIFFLILKNLCFESKALTVHINHLKGRD